jgi:tRNA(Ile)-lysidine synthase
MMNLSDRIVDCLRRHGLASTPGIIAVSGGPDSVALTHVCVGLLREGNLPRLVLAHMNHLLRGEESDADEAFIQQLPTLWQMADDFRLQCRMTRIDVAAIAKAERGNLESIARRERYGWLTQLAREERAAWIATGHSADDQAETVLFRLLRGSGVLGMGGMAERRPLDDGVCLIRPLLTTRRQALLDYLHERQIPCRVDSSNRDLRFTRNRLRLELLPRLEADFNPAVVDVLCRLAGQSQELSGEIVIQADKLRLEAEMPRAGAMLVFSKAKLQEASTNLVREMFRLVWRREGWPMGEMDFERWNWLVEIVREVRPACDFPGKIHARRVGGVVQIWKPA